MKKLLLILTFFASCSGTVIAQNASQLPLAPRITSANKDSVLLVEYWLSRPGINGGKSYKASADSFMKQTIRLFGGSSAPSYPANQLVFGTGSGSASSTGATWDSTNHVLNIVGALNLDATNGIYKFGNTIPGSELWERIIPGSKAYIETSNSTFKFLSIDGFSNVYSFGDINGLNNGLFIKVDDNNNKYTFNGLGGNGLQQVWVRNNGDEFDSLASGGGSPSLTTTQVAVGQTSNTFGSTNNFIFDEPNGIFCVKSASNSDSLINIDLTATTPMFFGDRNNSFSNLVPACISIDPLNGNTVFPGGTIKFPFFTTGTPTVAGLLSGVVHSFTPGIGIKISNDSLIATGGSSTLQKYAIGFGSSSNALTGDSSQFKYDNHNYGDSQTDNIFQVNGYNNTIALATIPDFQINGGQTRVRLGDYSLQANNTYVDINDSLLTIKLSANNGINCISKIIVNANQFNTLAASGDVIVGANNSGGLDSIHIGAGLHLNQSTNTLSATGTPSLQKNSLGIGNGSGSLSGDSTVCKINDAANIIDLGFSNLGGGGHESVFTAALDNSGTLALLRWGDLSNFFGQNQLISQDFLTNNDTINMGGGGTLYVGGNLKVNNGLTVNTLNNTSSKIGGWTVSNEATGLIAGTGLRISAAGDSLIATGPANPYRTSASITGQTTSQPAFAFYQPGGDSTFEIHLTADVTAISAGTLTFTVSYNDINGNGQTKSIFPVGVTSAGIVSVTAPLYPVTTIRASNGNNIIINANFTGVSITFDASALITNAGY